MRRQIAMAIEDFTRDNSWRNFGKDASAPPSTTSRCQSQSFGFHRFSSVEDRVASMDRGRRPSGL